MTKMKTQEPQYYIVPAQLTYPQREAFYHALDSVKSVEQAVATIGTPIPPCADVETVGYLVDEWDHGGYVTAQKPLCRSKMPKELVRRADMEAHVAHLSAEIARLRVVEAEMHLLEEVCAFYANDEDRFIKADGNAEPYGMIPTDVGMKARSARARFMAREQAAQEAGGKS
ncbi:hypothetical protein B0W47_07765 [Komagataeibacter nataicola]|uniref:Uncharacterized protein n=1 Tax=Komagataeibacter nataicola TaxID=265960 RepID=A0A9N7C7L1_9PROT|nr:hypothetical protein [Komagataeibacter nataicola]AQU87386.1 hypothetical protein B0W47_07765 [Komagataeibacter nataicola]PYD65277.1 hypothetical protein CDI09_14555 [Komagataeibacter nataicola]WNM09405.1 hypothetical protein RI056_05470 [Komagataeibacter nataicola]GBR18643.1 hypothetical protein AA0616_1345 [Komagataeibacter nataicola NRIC 0616]